jgi:hypothetical protein
MRHPREFQSCFSKLRCRAEGLSARHGANGKLGEKSAERKVHQRRSFMSRLKPRPTKTGVRFSGQGGMRHPREFQSCFSKLRCRGRVERPPRSERKARRQIRRKESSSEAFFYVAAKAATHKNRPSFLKARRDAALREFQSCFSKLRCRAEELSTSLDGFSKCGNRNCSTIAILRYV